VYNERQLFPWQQFIYLRCQITWKKKNDQRWLVKEGEPVTRGQVILEIETDKAVGEIEAPSDGVLKGRAG
jgi:biotin carboxyl carrier protein